MNVYRRSGKIQQLWYAGWSFERAVEKVDRDHPENHCQCAECIKDVSVETQADRRSHACVKAWEGINAHTDRLKADGLEVGVGDLYREMCEQALGA